MTRQKVKNLAINCLVFTGLSLTGGALGFGIASMLLQSSLDEGLDEWSSAASEVSDVLSSTDLRDPKGKELLNEGLRLEMNWEKLVKRQLDTGCKFPRVYDQGSCALRPKLEEGIRKLQIVLDIK